MNSLEWTRPIAGFAFVIVTIWFLNNALERAWAAISQRTKR